MKTESLFSSHDYEITQGNIPLAPLTTPSFSGVQLLKFKYGSKTTTFKIVQCHVCRFYIKFGECILVKNECIGVAS